jgi:integrase
VRQGGRRAGRGHLPDHGLHGASAWGCPSPARAGLRLRPPSDPRRAFARRPGARHAEVGRDAQRADGSRRRPRAREAPRARRLHRPGRLRLRRVERVAAGWLSGSPEPSCARSASTTCVTFGTIAANALLSGRELQEWMGHADLKTTARCLHYRARGDEAGRLADAFKTAAPTASGLQANDP